MEVRTMTEKNYKAISDYGIIGNLRSVALIAKDGSIDWCCLPRMDDPSVFGAILDSHRGGFCRISPVEGEIGIQEYVGDTNVLRTKFQVGEGALSVTDFMPLEGDINGRNDSHAPPEIHRLLECQVNPVEVEVVWAPRLDYARNTTSMEQTANGWICRCGENILSIGGMENEKQEEDDSGPLLKARFRLDPGDAKVVVIYWGSEDPKVDIDKTNSALQATLKTWNDWAHREGLVEKRVWAREQSRMVTRSALVFKLMNIADTGSIAAAPTTSLPEHIGGVRNWDYRYAWLRDAAMTAQALISIGHEEEAVDLLHWFEDVSKACAECNRELQIMYGLHGENELEEYELEHLEGYKGSKPVNIGNKAFSQFQLEVYGELVSTAYELARRGHQLQKEIFTFMAWIADHVVELWERPDYGIWEVRGEARHFVYSKVMAWFALDRALLLAEYYGLEGNVDRWKEEHKRIREQVMEKGFDKKLNSFVQSYGSSEMDAANLRLALVEFLPAEDPRIQGTINRTMEDLMEDDLIFRYISDDGLPGEEGAFGLCTFWLVDVLALSNRIEEAERIFNNMVARANHLGLFSEQIDPETGEFLGNFPQAFTHIGLINSTLYLAYAHGFEIPEHDPIGTPEHRENPFGNSSAKVKGSKNGKENK
jgi:GH15 family glucan-1,4-alpha-glucosidase